jgi:hypothetical protein
MFAPILPNPIIPNCIFILDSVAKLGSARSCRAFSSLTARKSTEIGESLTECSDQWFHVVGLLLHVQDLFHHDTASGIVIAEVASDFVAGDEI